MGRPGRRCWSAAKGDRAAGCQAQWSGAPQFQPLPTKCEGTALLFYTAPFTLSVMCVNPAQEIGDESTPRFSLGALCRAQSP